MTPLGPPKHDRPWRDGGYDRDEVEVCPHHPDHDWRIYRVGDLRPESRDPDEQIILCSACLVPCCGYSTDDDPCILPRHHPELHLMASGAVEKSREWPGTKKPPPPAIPIRHARKPIKEAPR